MKAKIGGLLIASTLMVGDMLTELDASYRLPINSNNEEVVTTTDELAYLYAGKLKSLDGVLVSKIFIVDSMCEYQSEFVNDILLMSNTTFNTVLNSNDKIVPIHESDMIYKLITVPNSIGIVSTDKIVLIKDNQLVIVKIEE